MVLKIVSVTTIFLAFVVSPIHGNSLTTTLNFLQNFNFLHLDLVSINFIEVEMTDFSDDNISILIEESDKFVKPLSLQNQKENHLYKSTLNVIAFEEMIVNKSNPNNCQVKGKFIKGSYKSYLIFGHDNIFQEDEETFMNSIKCNFPYQPYVYTFAQKNSYIYDLYEVQVVSQKFVHLATWNSTTRNTRY